MAMDNYNNLPPERSSDDLNSSADINTIVGAIKEVRGDSVNLSDYQTIGGVKIFSESPKAPEPIELADVATRAFVEQKVLSTSALVKLIGQPLTAFGNGQADILLSRGALELNGDVITNGALTYPLLAAACPDWGNDNDLELPDLTDRVMRTAGTLAGDAGTTQEDEVAAHTHYGKTKEGTTWYNRYNNNGNHPPEQILQFEETGSTGGVENRVKAFIIRTFVITDAYII